MKSAAQDRVTVRYLIREYLGVVILAAILFGTAGRLNWIWGWALVGLTFTWVTATAAVLLRRNPELMRERLGPRKGAKGWDAVIMGLVGLLTIVRLVVAGLDHRFGWSTGIGLPLQISAVVISAGAYALVVWATAENAFFSQIVRIQEERGHTVATGGPYRWVRHPAYIASLLNELSTPLLLGSWWALLPGGLAAVLFIQRTAMEDRTLSAELEGYAQYARQVRSRLVPGIW
jgi:protein-S-isoprenylcysteine O-methyltransferase Ste14